MKPDPVKIQGLQDLPSSKNCKQLQSLLGLINYLPPFLPNLASKTTLLREQILNGDWNLLQMQHFINLNHGYATHYLKQHLHILTTQSLWSYRQMPVSMALEQLSFRMIDHLPLLPRPSLMLKHDMLI